MNRLTALAAVLLCLLLSACGGGGGSTAAAPVQSPATTVTPPAAAPTVSLTLTPDHISTTQTTVLSWSSSNATACTASGGWSGSQTTSGSTTITPSGAGTVSYSLSCSGAGGSAAASAVLTVTAALNNSITIVVDGGPDSNNGTLNIPYVSVTVCRPGTTVCQTIDHIMLDTGSYGLRLLAPLASGLALPAVKTASGADAGACGKFISGYTWGAVRQADVKLADEVAAGISIQLVDDSGSSYASTPSSCSSAGNNIGSVAALGANGILGVGLFRQDCGSACAKSAVSGSYYACSSSGCVASAMPLATQISNPVASFAADNNGVLVVLPSVGAGGLTSVSGSLVFGVNTQANNTISGETLYKTNSSGDFSTSYKGKAYRSSFIDSGSNGYFFSDSTINVCSGGDFYCPASTLNLSATNSASDGSASGTVDFSVVNLDRLPQSISAAQVGGTSSDATSQNTVFDWGLPFFYGRRVFVVLEGNTINGHAAPLWAY